MVHFIDLNKNNQSPLSLPFTSQIRKCDAILRKIEYVKTIILLSYFLEKFCIIIINS
jgi:hypothetical protein